MRARDGLWGPDRCTAGEEAQGMREGLTEFYAALDALYSRQETDKIEGFLRRTLNEHRICCGSHDAVFVAALNELGTYYRGTGAYDKSVQAFTEAGVDIAGSLGCDSVEYATNRINLAGTLRLKKEYTRAQSLYHEAAGIYERIAGRGSYYYATVLNNLSLLYMDEEQYGEAMQCLQEALPIIRRHPEYREEEAVTLVNLGTCCWQQGKKEQAADYAAQALAVYESLPERGLHYAAALNLSGMVALEAGDYGRAVELFTRSKDVTESFFGRTEEYWEAEKSRQYAEQKLAGLGKAPAGGAPVSAAAASAVPGPAASPVTGQPQQGLAIAQAYYEAVGRPMLERKFASQLSRMAIGLAGDGSECLGFDDALSRDHDWGPSFCIWLTSEDYVTFGQELQRAYDALPGEFAGFPARRVFAGGEGRVGVLRIADFYRQFIGMARAPESIVEWSQLPENFLAKATNGAVFSDPLGKFSEIRNALLRYYPEDVRLKKIAVRAATMAQSGQYNYPRCLKRGERVAATCALGEFVQAACSMVYLLNHRYRPFYKWAHRGLRELPILSGVHQRLTDLCTARDGAAAQAEIEQICSMVRQEWARQHIVEGTSDFLIDYSSAIAAKIQDEKLRSLPLLQEC